MNNRIEKIIDMLFLINLFNLILKCPNDCVLFSFMKIYFFICVCLLMILWIVKYGYKCISKIGDDVFKIDKEGDRIYFKKMW